MCTENDRDEKEFQTVCKECKKYNMTAEYKFGTIYIHSLFGRWYYQINDGDPVKRLMHIEQSGLRRKDIWHTQFVAEITPEEIVRYIYEHDQAKFTNKFINFTFTKDGKKVIS